MSYITNSDIETRLGTTRYVQLTDDAGTGSANTAVADEVRLGAVGEVDSYLAPRYAVPIDLVTHVETAGPIKSAALDLAEYRLHARRREVPVGVIGKRDTTLAWLRNIAAGEASLPSVAELPANAAAGPRATTTGAARVLSREELEGF